MIQSLYSVYFELLICFEEINSSFAWSVRQVMDRVFSFLLWPKRKNEDRHDFFTGITHYYISHSNPSCTKNNKQTNKNFISIIFAYVYTNLLLAECEVRTASYVPSFFLPFMAKARSARAMKTRKEKTRIHNLPCGLSKRG